MTVSVMSANISMNASMFSCFCQIRRDGISRFFCYDNIAFLDGIFKSCKVSAVLSCPVFKLRLACHQIDASFASEMKAVSLISYSCWLTVGSILVPLSHRSPYGSLFQINDSDQQLFDHLELEELDRHDLRYLLEQLDRLGWVVLLKILQFWCQADNKLLNAIFIGVGSVAVKVWLSVCIEAHSLPVHSLSSNS